MEQRKNFNNQGLPKVNELGFAITGLVLVLPVLIAAILFYAIIFGNLKVQSHLNEICRGETEKILVVYQTELIALMALNPIIKIAKIVKGAAILIQLVSTFFAPWLISMMAQIIHLAVRVEEIVYKLQTIILNIMNKTIKFGNRFVKNHIHFTFNNYKFKIYNFLKLDNFKLRHNQTPIVAVEKKNPSQKLSEYMLMNDFERKQKLFYSWSFESSLVYKFNKIIYSNKDQFQFFSKLIKGHCVSTLAESKPWNPIPIKVKF